MNPDEPRYRALSPSWRDTSLASDHHLLGGWTTPNNITRVNRTIPDMTWTMFTTTNRSLQTVVQPSFLSIYQPSLSIKHIYEVSVSLWIDHHYTWNYYWSIVLFMIEYNIGQLVNILFINHCFSTMIVGYYPPWTGCLKPWPMANKYSILFINHQIHQTIIWPY